MEYIDIGGMLDVTAFNRNIIRACGILDNETHNRLANMMADIPDAVKYCLRDLVEYLDMNKLTATNIASRSQTAGGVSESISYNNQSTEDILAGANNIIYDYLQSVKDDNGTSLLYRGGGY